MKVKVVSVVNFASVDSYAVQVSQEAKNVNDILFFIQSKLVIFRG